MGAFKKDRLIDMDDKKEFTNKMEGRVLLGKKQHYKGLQARQGIKHAWPKQFKIAAFSSEASPTGDKPRVQRIPHHKLQEPCKRVWTVSNNTEGICK